MHILTNEQVQKVDEETIDRICPGIELMERAGRGCAEFIVHKYGGGDRKVVIFVGSGNNGGDGLVIARYLNETGWRCSVHLLKSPDELTPDTGKNYQRLLEVADRAPGVTIYEADRPDWIERAEADVEDCDLIVDCIFGSGIHGAPRGTAVDMIQLINDSVAPAVAIDIPSGVDGSTGDSPGEAVIAADTLTIGVPKVGTLFHPGKHLCGEVSVIDIGFPDDIIEKYAEDVFLLDDAEAAMRLPMRAPDLHKFDAGVLVLVAGSDQYRGAALLAGEAALRGGCGLVYLGVPESIRPEIDVALREIITVPLPETAAGTIAPAAVEHLAGYIDRAHAVAIGPGLGRHDDTARFITTLLAEAELPAVVDADAISAFAVEPDQLDRIEHPLVITPHTGELERLLDEAVPMGALERIDFASRVAERFGVTLVLKGAPTLVADPGEGVWVCAAGNSALATGGTGDVLTGLVGSLLAQGADPLDAACAATYLHGRAGELAALEMGKRAVIAGDLLWAVGGAMAHLEMLVGD